MENEKEFLKKIHDQYYGKRKKKERIEAEKKKQMSLFDEPKDR